MPRLNLALGALGWPADSFATFVDHFRVPLPSFCLDWKPWAFFSLALRSAVGCRSSPSCFLACDVCVCVRARARRVCLCVLVCVRVGAIEGAVGAVSTARVRQDERVGWRWD